MPNFLTVNLSYMPSLYLHAWFQYLTTRSNTTDGAHTIEYPLYELRSNLCNCMLTKNQKMNED